MCIRDSGYMVNGVMRFLIVSDRDTWPEYTGLIHKHIIPSKAVCDTINHKIKRIVEDACNRIGILNGPVYFQMKVLNGHPVSYTHLIMVIRSRRSKRFLCVLVMFWNGFRTPCSKLGC